MRFKIELSTDEVALADSLATKRNHKQARFGAMTYGGVLGSVDAHVVGVLAEIAIAKDAGVEPDSEIYDTHGDDGADLIIPGFGRTSVKANQYENDSYLRVPTSQLSKPIETFVLCIVPASARQHDGSAVILAAGWATRAEVAAANTWAWVSGGPVNHNLHERHLRQWCPPWRMSSAKDCAACGWVPVEAMGCNWCRQRFCYDCYWTHPHD